MSLSTWAVSKASEAWAVATVGGRLWEGALLGFVKFLEAIREHLHLGAQEETWPSPRVP